MARFFRSRSKKIGKAPGSLIFVGQQKTEAPSIDAIIFDKKSTEVKSNLSVVDLQFTKEEGKAFWVNLVGIHDDTLIKELGDFFHLHPLMQEDIMNTTQRPKFEEFDDHLFLVLKMLSFNHEKQMIESEQLSITVGKNLLISFQEVEGDVFSPLRERLTRPTTKIRQRGSDYLAFAMLDAIVDQYIYIIEIVGDKIEALESVLLDSPQKSHLATINLHKKEINYLRKTVRPVRELVSQFRRSESPLIRPDTIQFLKDLEDHALQATEAIELYTGMLTDQLDMYNSSMNNRLNDIIRILTVFSVVFIPLTFMAGIYGTNFEYFPELGYKYSYPIFWIAMITVAIAMILFFKRRKWL